LLVQEKQVLEETVSRNKKQLNQNEISKQQLQKQVTEKSSMLEGHEKTIKDQVGRIEDEGVKWKNLNEEKTNIMEEKRDLQRERDDSNRALDQLRKTYESKCIDLDETEQNKNQGIVRLQRQDKEIQKYEREIKNMLGKNNALDSQREQAYNDKMVATNAVSALTREIEWINKQTDKE